ncbi:dTDP-glucose 4,6-dehydratase [Psychromonas sp.]|uniref:dTDP-glucose 4,6-dehydratase n=1 Tax=Psychromonas sp. TaxID=1884585 RepID=UPI00356B60F1
MNKSISILGSGWLGFPLAKQLTSEFEKVNISTRSEEKSKLLEGVGLRPFIIDMQNLKKNIQSFLQTDTLIINVTGKDINAFKNLISEIEKSPVKEVLFISSTSVYPEHSGLCRESRPLDISSHPLLEIEALFQQNTHFKSTILRFSGLIGGKRHPGRFFATGKSIRLAEAGVNLIHLDDCLAIIAIIVKQHVFPELLNCCADTHPRKVDFYTANALALGLPKPQISSENRQSNKIVSNEKLKKRLNYQFIHGDLMQLDARKDYDLN